jgi:hypothetical protein
MKKILTSLLCLFALCYQASADSFPAPRWIITTTPQYMINNALKFSVEKKTWGKHWTGISVEFYYGPVNTDNSAYGPDSKMLHMSTTNDDLISGFGIGLTDKLFVDPNAVYSGFYLGYGLNYNYLNVSYKDYTWYTYEKDGLQYYGYDLKNGTLAINRYTGYIGIGYGVDLSKNFRADFFMGGGYTKSQSNSSLNGNFRNFNRDFFDYQFSGGHPVMTVQFGYLF